MMTDSEIRKHIAEIEALPVRLYDLVSKMNDTQLDTPYREGGWTVRQVVHHLADSHMNAYIRMRLIMTEDEPTLKPYNQEAWADLADAKQAPVGESLVILEGLHKRWVRFLQGMKGPDLQRTGIHPEIGTVTLLDMLLTYSRHCQNHLKHIRRVSG